jgi:nicotinate-nucleotide adenylyltransferase
MRIALYGGTFDPIHYGHLICAEEVRQAFALDRVWFVPAYRPPHKSDDPLRASPEDRYEMVCAAVEGNPAFAVSRSELDRGGTSYAIDTVREFRRQFGAYADIYWILGFDALAEIETWRDWQTLLALCRFIAVTRPGYRSAALSDALRNRVESFTMTDIGISSTRIRETVRNGGSIRYWTPPRVVDYIETRQLYRRP